MPGFSTLAIRLALAIACLGAGSACRPGIEPAEAEALRGEMRELRVQVEQLNENFRRTFGPRPSGPAAGPPPEDFEKVHSIDLAGSPVKGDPDAPVAIVEFSDFQCPYCASLQPLLAALLEKYPGRVKLVYKHFPLDFHQNARPAALASIAAGEQGKFWELHDLLFENQKALDAAGIESYAQRLGLDVERFKRDLADKRAAYEERVETDLAQGREAGVRGTPTVYVAGRKVRDRSVAGMSALVERALEEASGSG